MVTTMVEEYKKEHKMEILNRDCVLVLSKCFFFFFFFYIPAQEGNDDSN
jgi:hypothetical protein